MSNFQKRVISSIVGGALMILLLVVGRELLLGGLCVVSIVGLFELTKACKIHDESKKVNSLEAIAIVGTIVWYVLIEILHDNIASVLAAGFLTVIVSLLAFMVVYVLTFPKYNADQVMAAMFSLIYCPIMISFIYLIRMLNYGILLVWIVFVCSWICDICAYLVGVKIGKHKFVPKLSPKKSLEGAIGGVLGSALVGGIYAGLVFTKQIETSRSTVEVVLGIVIISMLGAMFSMFGDLAASAIKRNNDIKDYGNIIPGHGGVMDRFDSVIFVAPVIYALSLVFLHVMG